MNTILIIIIFAMAAINVPFIVQDPTRWWNWMSAIICFGLGIVSTIWNRK